MKKGFTLAEVLITLGVVGVITALTLPSLMANVEQQKIGPKLGKAVADFEQANAVLLNANSVDSLGDIPNFNANYMNALSNYLKVTVANSGNGGLWLIGKNNISYAFDSLRNPNLPQFATTIHPKDTLRGTLRININANKGLVNSQIGEDVFFFGMYDDGSLKPKGGEDPWDGNDNQTWQDNCPVNQTPTNAEYCAGHIFANGMKVLYK